MSAKNLFAKANSYALKVRGELDLKDEPIGDVFKVLYDSGVLVVKMPIEEGTLSGCFLYDRELDQTWVMINSARTMGHQRFSAAHEYCHSLRDKERSFIVCEEVGVTNKPAHEKFADQFAASFLLPENILLYRFRNSKSTISPKAIVEICLEFGVSYESAIWRLRSLNLIGDMDRATLSIASPVSIAKSLGVNPENPKNPFVIPIEKNPIERLPKDYLKLAIFLFKKDRISKGKLAEYLEVDLDDVDSFLDSQKSPSIEVESER